MAEWGLIAACGLVRWAKEKEAVAVDVHELVFKFPNLDVSSQHLYGYASLSFMECARGVQMKW